MSTLDTDATLDANDAATGPDGLSRAGKVLFNSLEQRMFGQSDVQRLGRYHLIDTLGRGAMGIVYRAYDPDLDRRVAIKVVTLDGEEARARMVREAKVLAKLNHPNVVTVHEVGEDGDDLFVVMEYVDGGTLGDWAKAHPKDEPGRNDALIEFAIQALEGLSAAHELGLVHRDIKPANILIGENGRLRIADFGLARAGAAELEATKPGDSRALESEDDVALTRAGQIVGTPAFMAPEQFKGVADARSDQFGLAVSFYAAFFEQRPFETDSIAALLEAIEGGHVDAPLGVVPNHVRDALLRAMRPNPEERFEDARAMARSLRVGGRRRTRLLGLAGVAAAATVAGGVAWGAAPEPCRDERNRADGVVSPHVARVEALLAESVRPHADELSRRFSIELDRLVDGWSDRRLQACRDARVQEPEKAALAERRLQCLDDGLASVDRALAEIDSLTPDQADGLPSMVEILVGFVRCEDPDRRLADARGRELYERFDLGRVADNRHESEEARENFESILASTEEGELPELRSEVFMRLAVMAVDYSDSEGFSRYTSAAVNEAVRSGDPELQAYAWGLAAKMVPTGESIATLEMFLSLSHTARESAELSDFASANLAASEAELLTKWGFFDRALRVIDEALPRAVRARSVLVASLHGLKSSILQRTGQLDEAERLAKLAVDAAVERLGEHHPDVATLYMHLGQVQSWQGNEEASVETVSHAISIMDARPGRFRENTFAALNGRGDSYGNLGRFDEAIADYDRALEIAESITGANTMLAAVKSSKARVLTVMGRHEDALSLLDEALSSELEKSVGGRDLRADTAILRARVLATLERSDEAKAQLDDAVPWVDEAFGTEGAPRLQAAAELAEVWIEMGDYARADAEVDRFLPQAEQDALFRGMLQRMKAEGLAAQGKREQAKTWAERALESMMEAGVGEAERTAIVELLGSL